MAVLNMLNDTLENEYDYGEVESTIAIKKGVLTGILGFGAIFGCIIAG